MCQARERGDGCLQCLSIAEKGGHALLGVRASLHYTEAKH